MQLHFLFESTRERVAAGDVRGIVELWQSVNTTTKQRAYEMSTTYDETAGDQNGSEHETFWTSLQTNVFHAVLPAASDAAGRAAAAETGRAGGEGVLPAATDGPHSSGRDHRHHHQHVQHQNGEPRWRRRQAKRTDVQVVGYSGWKPGSRR